MRSFFLVLIPCVACGDPSILDGSGAVVADEKIFGGSAATDPEHDAVVALHRLSSTGGVYVSPFCTGTLIRDDLVLTAAHCLDTSGGASFTEIAANRVAIFVGTKASTSTTSSEYIWDHLYTVSEVEINSAYNKSTMVNDIGLLRLASDAATAEGVTPVPELPSSVGFTSADVGTLTLNFAGFGQTETGATGTKLQADGVLGGLGCTVTGCTTSGDSTKQISYDQGNGGTYDPGDEGPCFGDSGGPAFVTRSGTVYVGGTTSYGDSACTNYGVSTRADAYGTWISTFDGGSTGGGGTTASCGDGTCDSTESCDGRYSTTSCSSDCAGKTTGKPSGRYCWVGSTCEGTGC